MVTGLGRDLEEFLDELPEATAARLRELLGSPQKLLAQSLGLGAARGRMRLGTLSTGLWRAGGVRAEELQIELKADGVALENSRVELNLVVELGFQLPSLRSKEPRIFKTGQAPGRVTMPTLKRVDLSSLTREMGLSFVLSAIDTNEATADVAPLENVDAGLGSIGDLEARDIEALLSPSGLRVDGLAVDGVRLRTSAVREVEIGKLETAEQIEASDVLIREVSIPKAHVGTVEGGELDLDFELRLPRLKIKTFPEMPAFIERLVTRFWVEIIPTLYVHIGNLCFDGLAVTAKIGALRFKNLTLPFEVTKVAVHDVELDDLNIGHVKT